MISKAELVVLNGHNYAIWVTYMETLLGEKWPSTFMKTIVHSTDVDAKSSIDVKKDEVVGIITTYISRETHFIKVGSNVLMLSRTT